MKAPQLHIRSRKAPSPDGFIQHSSKIESFSLKPYYLLWNAGKIEKVLLPKGQAKALSNLQKGIASLFQVLFTSFKILSLIFCFLVPSFGYGNQRD